MKRLIIKILKFLFGYHKSDRKILAIAVPIALILATLATLANLKPQPFPTSLIGIPIYFDPIWLYGTILMLRCICWESFFLIRRFSHYLIGE